MEESKAKDETRLDVARLAGGSQQMPVLTSDRVFHWWALGRSTSPILPTALAADPRLSHAEPGPSIFVSPRLPGRSCFFGQRFAPVRDAAAENECASPAVPP